MRRDGFKKSENRLLKRILNWKEMMYVVLNVPFWFFSVRTLADTEYDHGDDARELKRDLEFWEAMYSSIRFMTETKG